MPKIIEHVRERLLNEAKRQIRSVGYAKTTVRSVADACGVGVGTVYNYFPSKDMLIAGFVALDWQKHLDAIASLSAEEPRRLMEGIFDALRTFAESNRVLFSDADAAKAISAGYGARHKLLRRQIADFILPICPERGQEDPDFLSLFLSESLIAWAMEDVEFDTVYGVIEPLFRK